MLVVNRKASSTCERSHSLSLPHVTLFREVASYYGASEDAMDVCSGGCVPSTRGAGGISGGLPSHPRLAAWRAHLL